MEKYIFKCHYFHELLKYLYPFVEMYADNSVLFSLVIDFQLVIFKVCLF